MDALPLSVSQVASIPCAHARERTTVRHVGAFQNTLSFTIARAPATIASTIARSHDALRIPAYVYMLIDRSPCLKAGDSWAAHSGPDMPPRKVNAVTG